MVSRINPSPPLQPVALSADQLRKGIERLGTRLATVRQFAPESVRDWDSPPELEILCADIDDALVRTFGYC